MNKILLFGFAGFLGILIIGVIVFVFLQINARRKSTNLELPDIDELEKDERIRKMEARRSSYTFEVGEELSADKIGTSDEDEVDPSLYIKKTATTSVADDFGGLLGEDGSIKAPTPNVVQNNISLPDIDDSSLTDKKKNVQDDIEVDEEIDNSNRSIAEQLADEASETDGIDNEDEVVVSADSSSLSNSEQVDLNVINHEDDKDANSAESAVTDNEKKDDEFSLPNID